MSFKHNPEHINRNGRPKRIGDLIKKTNRQLREEELMSLVRKFKPHQTAALQAALRVMNREDASDQNVLKASALILSTYRSLLLDVYDIRYDEDEGTEVQEKPNGPVFSLKMIDPDEKVA